MLDRRIWLLSLGIPGLLLYGTLGVAQWRSAEAMREFTQFQKAYPPDSLKKIPGEVEQKKLNALALAERLAPDNSEVAYQLSLHHLVHAETLSLQPAPNPTAGDERPDPRLLASLNESLKWINRSIVLNPGFAEYHFVKATLLQNLSGVREASSNEDDNGSEIARLLRLADQLDPYKPSLHYRVGSFWLALGNVPEARKAFSIALTDSFQFARPVFDLLWSSVEDVTDLQNFVGDNPLSRALLGDFLWIHGFRKEAQEQFEKVEAAPEIDYLTGEALIAHYIREYQGERARTVIARMLKDGSGLSSFYQSRLEYFRGKSFSQEHRYQEAISCYERSLALDPSVVQSHLELASAYLEEGQPQKAIARWKFVLARGIPVPREVSGPGEIHYGLGRAYEALGDRGRALSEYLTASSEDPGNTQFSQKASDISRGL